MTSLAFALCIVAATLITLARVVPFRLILGYATLVDVVFSMGMLGFFAGTLTGAMAAVLAGLILAVALTLGRKVFGYQRFALSRSGGPRRAGGFARNLMVVDFPPGWKVSMQSPKAKQRRKKAWNVFRHVVSPSAD
tara:strand:+ start:40079 stop:40486 length:408 start_codon:yes stop_codon:yes gene_type:complete